MNRAEVSLLLGVCASFDARTIGEADVIAWHDVLGDLNYSDAVNAVKSHYGSSADRIMPAHVRSGVRQIRRERVNGADASFVFSGDPDNTREFQRQLKAHRQAVGDGRPDPEAPHLEQRFRPQELAGVFQSVPLVRRTLIPAQRLPPSPRAVALARLHRERAAGHIASEALEGEIIPPEKDTP